MNYITIQSINSFLKVNDKTLDCTLKYHKPHYLYTLHNAIKSLFGCSDWQIAEKNLKANLVKKFKGIKTNLVVQRINILATYILHTLTYSPYNASDVPNKNNVSIDDLFERATKNALDRSNPTQLLSSTSLKEDKLVCINLLGLLQKLSNDTNYTKLKMAQIQNETSIEKLKLLSKEIEDKYMKF